MSFNTKSLSNYKIDQIRLKYRFENFSMYLTSDFSIDYHEEEDEDKYNAEDCKYVADKYLDNMMKKYDMSYQEAEHFIDFVIPKNAYLKLKCFYCDEDLYEWYDPCTLLLRQSVFEEDAEDGITAGITFD